MGYQLSCPKTRQGTLSRLQQKLKTKFLSQLPMTSIQRPLNQTPFTEKWGKLFLIHLGDMHEIDPAELR